MKIAWWRWAIPYSIIGVIVAAAILMYGRELGVHTTVTKNVAAYCKTLKDVERCVEEQAPPGSTVTCHAAGTGEYACEANTGLGGCYAVTAKRSAEGYPVVQTAAQENSCG